MRWKTRSLGVNMVTRAAFLVVILAICSCDGARRPAQRRSSSRSAELYEPAPSAESLQAIAQAMGAAGFEHYTEGRPLVKRLIPADSQPDLDVVEHQGVIGKAGVDFPAYPNIPNTGFSCKNVPTGYYADLETDCQVFHICDTSRKISFLCPNGTIFSQSHLICDWWFKVDCASAPALYESSAEYYSNEQKKTQKVTQSLSKNHDLQQIGTDTNVRAESRRTSVNVPSIPSTTERLLRHRQRLQNDPLPQSKATARSFQALFETPFSPTQRTQATTAFEKRRKNLVQLIANNFGNLPAKATSPTYNEGPVYRPTTAAPAYDHNSIREMQVAAETASFAANNNNRQFLQDYNNKNYRPYPVYTPNVPKPASKPKQNSHLTTLYNFRDRHLEQTTEKPQEWTTKRSTLVPYTRSYSTPNHDRRDPYTRPGISLLKDFLEKEKNNTLETSTENVARATATDRSDRIAQNKVTIETKDTYESATKIPSTTRSLNYASETASSIRFETHTTPDIQVTTEPYQERRERLIRKLNLGTLGESTPSTTEPTTEKFYGDLPNRPGLIVPPSLTPKTLHSLAIYYATALDNLSTTATPDDSDISTPSFDEYEPLEEELPGLFSRHTLNKYSSLFGHGQDNSELLEDIKLDPNGTYNDLAEDLTVQQSQNPLATSPQIRELAQVFTHALSAYLQDPVQFRKVLSDIRPTHPSFADIGTTEEYSTEPTTTVNEDDEEILGFSDDIKSRPALTSLRDPKALNIATIYPTISDQPITTQRPYTTTTEVVSTAYSSTLRNPFRCCGRISASYTTASTPISIATTPAPYTNTDAVKVNTLANNYLNEKLVVTTESSYEVPRYAGFQNNTSTQNSPYGAGVSPTQSQPLNEYIEVTNLPTAWGIDTSVGSTASPTGSPATTFESKKIRISTIIPETTPVYFTETDSVELENEEELQRAHSQSFIAPQGNSLRQGKQIQFETTSTTVKKPSEDLEAPTISERVTTTTVQPTTQPQPTTTVRIDEAEASTTASPILTEVFTSPDSEKTTNQFQWPSTFEVWHSTVYDPITLNEGLSLSGADQGSQVGQQTNAWALSTTTAPSTDYTGPSEQTVSPSINVELTTPSDHTEDRFGRLLRGPTSTEPAQDISAITDTVVEKAKEIMEGMNATTTQKLMNVMKKTKSKTVRRLILLLVQTCDDDHNTTAEASKKALLEALMAVSQKDMEEIAKEEEQSQIQTTASDYEEKPLDYKRTDRFVDNQGNNFQHSERRGKSLDFNPSAVNSLSSPTTTTEFVKTTTEAVTTTTPARTTLTSRRGAKKFSRTTLSETKVTSTPFVDVPRAEARSAAQPELKGASDTRALELLRSLYTIAARWG